MYTDLCGQARDSRRRRPPFVTDTPHRSEWATASIHVGTVAHSATLWHMSAPREVSQRDLRMRSKEIMDAVERGDSFTITRDGHQIGQLVPLRRRRRFVSRAEFAQGSQLAPMIDVATFRADQDSAYDQTLSDPYAR